MGVRFHRSIKIAKGIRLNISKKGLGTSLGPKGAKVSFGPNGVYSNVGIPGSGLYSRKKLNSRTPQQKMNSSSNSEVNVDIKLLLDDETGIETILISKDGVPIDDARLLRKIKSERTFKEKLKKFREKASAEINNSTDELVNIHKYSSPLPDWNKLLKESKEKQPELYFKKAFTIKKPDIVVVTKKLQIEAYDKINPLFFKSRKRKEYVESKKKNYLNSEIDKWETEKEKFEKQELKNEKKVNATNRIEFDKWVKEVELTFNPTVDFLTEQLNQYISEIKLPVDFSISFDVIENGKKIYLNIDLPEIKDYPQKKAKILASGKVSVKDKSMKEKKHDYLRSISGMSIYFTSVVFSISPAIEEVIVSAYTQRTNKASGNIEDEYVYSVKYEKEQFAKLNIDNIEPELTLKSFVYRMKTTAKYDLRKIEPFKV